MKKKSTPSTIRSRYDYFSSTMSPPNATSAGSYYDDQAPSLYGDPVPPASSLEFADSVHNHLFGNFRQLEYRHESHAPPPEPTTQASDVDSGVHILSGNIQTPDSQQYSVTMFGYNQNPNMDEPRKMPSSYASKVRRRRADLARSAVNFTGTRRISSRIPISRTRSFPNRDDSLIRMIPSGPSLEMDENDSSNSNQGDTSGRSSTVPQIVTRISTPPLNESFVRTSTGRHRPSIDSEVSTTYVDVNIPPRTVISPPSNVQKRISFQTNQSSDDQESVIGGRAINYSNYRNLTQQSSPNSAVLMVPSATSPQPDINRNFAKNLEIQRHDSMTTVNSGESRDSDIQNEFTNDIYPVENDAVVRMIPSRATPELDIDNIIPDHPYPPTDMNSNFSNLQHSVRLKEPRPPLQKDDSLIIMIPSGPSIEKAEPTGIMEGKKQDVTEKKDIKVPPVSTSETSSKSSSVQPKIPTQRVTLKPKSAASKEKKQKPSEEMETVPPVDPRMPGLVAYRILADRPKGESNSLSDRMNSESDTSKTSMKTVLSKRDNEVTTTPSLKAETPKTPRRKGILKEYSPDFEPSPLGTIPVLQEGQNLVHPGIVSPATDYPGNSDSTARPRSPNNLSFDLDSLIEEVGASSIKISDPTGKIRMQVIQLNDSSNNKNLQNSKEDVSIFGKKPSSMSSDDIQMRFGNEILGMSPVPTSYRPNDSFSGSDWYRPSNDFQEFSRIPRMRPASKNIIAINQDNLRDDSPLVALIQDLNGSSSGDDKEMSRKHGSLMSESSELTRIVRPKTSSTSHTLAMQPKSVNIPKRDVSPVIVKSAITTGSTYRADPPRAHKKGAFTVLADDFNSGMGAKRMIPIKHRPQSSPNRVVMSASRLRLPAIANQSTSDTSPRPSVQFDVPLPTKRVSSAHGHFGSKGFVYRKPESGSQDALPKIGVEPPQSALKRPQSSSNLKSDKSTSASASVSEDHMLPNPTSKQPGLIRVVSLPDLSPSRVLLMKMQEIEDVLNKESKYGSQSKLGKRKTFNMTKPSTLKKKSSSHGEITNEQLFDHITSSFAAAEPDIPQKSPSRFFGDLSRPKTIFQYTNDMYSMNSEDRRRFLNVDDPGYMPRSPRRIIKRSTLSPIIGTPNKDDSETPEKRIPPSPRFNVRRRSSVSDISSIPFPHSRQEAKSKTVSRSMSPQRKGKGSHPSSPQRRRRSSISEPPKKPGRSRSNSVSKPTKNGKDGTSKKPQTKASPKNQKGSPKSRKTAPSMKSVSRSVSKVAMKPKSSEQSAKKSTAAKKDTKATTKSKSMTTSAKKNFTPIGKLVSTLKKSSQSVKKETQMEKKGLTRRNSSTMSLKRQPSSLKFKNQTNDAKDTPTLKREQSNLKKDGDRKSPVKREASNLSNRSGKKEEKSGSAATLRREGSGLVLKKPKTDVMAKLKRQTANIIKMRNAGSTFGTKLSKRKSKQDLKSEAEDEDGDKLVPLTKANVVSMTTAAITAQPVEVTTKIHNAVSKTKSQHSLLSNKTTATDSGASLDEFGEAHSAAILEKSQKTLETVQKTVTEATEEIQKTISENLTNLKSLESEMKETIDIGGIPETIFEKSESVETVIENPLKRDNLQQKQKESGQESPAPPSQPIEAKVSVITAKKPSSHQLIPPKVGSATSSTTSSINGEISTQAQHHREMNNVGVEDMDERVSERAISALPEVECESANFQKKGGEQTIIGEVMESGPSRKNKDGKMSSNDPSDIKNNNGSAGKEAGIIAHGGGGDADKSGSKKSSGSQEYLEGETPTGCCGKSKCGRACTKMCMPCRSLRRLSCCSSKCCTPCCACCRRKKIVDSEKVSVTHVDEKKPSRWSCMNCCRREKKPPRIELQQKMKAQRMESIQEEVDVEKGLGAPKANKCRMCCRNFFCCGCMRKKGKKKDIEKKVAPLVSSPPKPEEDVRKCCFCIPCGRKKPEMKAVPEKRRESILSEPGPKLGLCARLREKMSFKKKRPTESRRPSMSSKKHSIAPTNPPEDTRPKLHIDLVEFTSKMKAAIPVMPLWLAYFCMFCNVVIPGTGTALSGLFCLCVGIPRFSQYDSAKARLGSFVINCIIGVAQIFCVIFCCVGWGWSIWWGTIMLKTARKLRKIRRIEKLEQMEEQRQAALRAAQDAEAAQA